MKNKILYILYQPYKWLIYIPFLVVNTFLFGIVAVLVSSLVNQKLGSYFGGVIWSRLNAYLVPISVEVKGRKNISKNFAELMVKFVTIDFFSKYSSIFSYGYLEIVLLHFRSSVC